MTTPVARRKPTSTRIEHRERMRADILRSARELIATQGIDAMTMRKLGHKVGVTAATLYGYFPSREMVLQALLEEKIATMNSMLREYGRNSDRGLARLLAYAAGYRQFAMQYPDFYDLYICQLEPPRWGNLESDPEPQSEILAAMHREIGMLMERGKMRVLDIDTVLRLLWSAAHGYISLERTNCFGTLHLDAAGRDAHYLEHMGTMLRGFLTGAGIADMEHMVQFAGRQGQARSENLG